MMVGAGVVPEKVVFEQRLWKRGGNRPGKLGGRGSCQCKGPEARVCTGTSVEPEEARATSGYRMDEGM